MRIVGLALIAGAIVLSGCTPKKQDPANTLHLPVPAKIKGLDPVQADDLYAGDEVSKGYEGLYQYHYLKRPYVMIPNLAESMPEVSADGKTYTIKLKKGVLFHDDPCFTATNGKGREMTADDVIYSWKRLADPKTASPGFWIFDGKIVGLNEWHDEAAKSGTSDYSKPVEGLKAIDPYTLQVKLTAKNYQFLYGLGMTFSYIVAREAVEKYATTMQNHVVGTGPFRLVSFNGSSRIVWDRNPTYRKETYPSEGEPADKDNGLLADAGKPLPLADRIVTEIYEETQPAWLNLMAGKLDAGGIPKDNFGSAINPDKTLKPELAAKGLSLAHTAMLDITHLTFNFSDPLVGKNKLLRQAMSMAYDPLPIIDLFYNGRAIPAQGPIPPGLEGYDPTFKNPYRVHDVEKAKALLAKAGYPGGKGLPPLEYATLSDSTSRQMTEYLQKAMADIGVQVKVNTYSWPEFQASVKNKRGQIWEFAWGADYPDAENFLQLFYSKNGSPGANDANYNNPEFDKMYEKSLTMPDSPTRTALYKDMVKLLVEDCPWIWGVHRESWNLTQRWMKNYKYHEVEHARFKYYRVDPALKK